MSDSTFTTIWEFQVQGKAGSHFPQIYGPEGDWAQLFRRSPDYKGTVLLHDADNPGRYLTIDHWTSQDALQQFKRDHATDYRTLDQRCEAMTEREVFIGNFHIVERS